MSDLITIIVPVYNEETTLPQVLEKLISLPFQKQIIVVDDGSHDRTPQILRDFKSRNIDVVFIPQNHGKGYAIRQAIPLAKGQVTVIQDADLEYNPEFISQLIQPILKNQVDAVYGARFIHSEKFTYHALTNKLITGWFNLISGMRLNDMETGAKAFRTSLLQKIKLTSNRFGFEPEITIRLHKIKIPILEVEYPHYISRTHAEGKKIKFKDGIAAVWHILRFNLWDSN